MTQQLGMFYWIKIRKLEANISSKFIFQYSLKQSPELGSHAGSLSELFANSCMDSLCSSTAADYSSMPDFACLSTSWIYLEQ